MSQPYRDILNKFKTALNLSVYVLEREPLQLPSQLYGRLYPGADYDMRKLCESAVLKVKHPWLRPVNPCLTKPFTGIERIIRAHYTGVQAIAASKEGSYAITAPAPLNPVLYRRERAIIPTALRRPGVEGSESVKVRFEQPVIFDLKKGKKLTSLNGHEDDVNTVAMTDDGTIAVTGCGRRRAHVKWFPFQVDERRVSLENKIRIWSVPEGRLLQVLEGHKSAVTCLSISKDGKYLISGSDDAVASVWDLNRGCLLKQFNGHTAGLHRIRTMVFEIDGAKVDMVFSASFTEFIAWRIDTLEVIARYPLEPLHDEPIGFSPFGPTLFVQREMIGWSKPYTIRATSMADGSVVESERSQFPFVVFVTDSGGDLGITAVADDTTANLWSIPSFSKSTALAGHSGDLTCACFTAGDTKVLTGSMDGTILLWDLDAAEREALPVLHEDDINALVVDPLGTKVFSGSYDRTVKVSKAPLCEDTKLIGSHDRSVTSLALTADGNILISGSLDGTIRSWEVLSSELINVERHGSKIQAVTVDGLGRSFFSAANDGSVMQWDLLKPGNGRLLTKHSAPVRALAYEYSTSRLYLGAEDGAIMVIAVLNKGNCDLIYQHPEPIMALKAGPEQTLIIGDYTGSVACYTKQGVCLTRIKTFEGAVFALDISQDKTLLAAVSDDRTARIWEISTWKEIASFTADVTLFSVAFHSNRRLYAGAGNKSGRLHVLQLENWIGGLDVGRIN